MIFLKSKNIIFIKTRKTAGTSVEIALSVHAGKNDIVTRISPEDELVRIDAGGRLPVNWAGNPGLERRYRKAIRRAREDRGLLGNIDQKALKRKSRFQNHMPPAAISDLIGADTFASAHKFTVVRNPYEQLVSAACFRMRNRPGRTVSEEVDQLLSSRKKYRPNCDLYFLDGEMIIDTFIRYERLRHDLEQFSARFELEIVEHLPMTKQQFRPDRTPAAELLTRQQKALCQDYCAWEFERFGYER